MNTGTCVKITTEIIIYDSTTPPDSVKLTVYDPNNVKKVDAVAMTLVTGGAVGSNYVGTYEKIYQNAKTDAVGKYTAEVEVLKADGYTPLKRTKFSLEA